MDSGSTPMNPQQSQSTSLEYFISMFNSEDVPTQQKLMIMQQMSNKAGTIL